MPARLALLLVPAVLAVLLSAPAATAATATTATAGAADPVGVWPLVPAPEVVRGFDPPEEAWGAGHRGVDLLGSPGQAVRSALPGRVSFAGVVAGRGVVVVDHGATRTTYEPVAATVGVGEPVAAGARLGRLAAAGSHCLPRTCLHWGWIQGVDTYLDPLRLVGGGPVRLLPLWRDRPAGTGGSSPVVPWRPPLLPYAGWRPLLDLLLGPGVVPLTSR